MVTEQEMLDEYDIFLQQIRKDEEEEISNVQKHIELAEWEFINNRPYVVNQNNPVNMKKYNQMLIDKKNKPDPERELRQKKAFKKKERQQAKLRKKEAIKARFKLAEDNKKKEKKRLYDIERNKRKKAIGSKPITERIRNLLSSSKKQTMIPQIEITDEEDEEDIVEDDDNFTPPEEWWKDEQVTLPEEEKKSRKGKEGKKRKKGKVHIYPDYPLLTERARGMKETRNKIVRAKLKNQIKLLKLDIRNNNKKIKRLNSILKNPKSYNKSVLSRQIQDLEYDTISKKEKIDELTIERNKYFTIVQLGIRDDQLIHLNNLERQLEQHVEKKEVIIHQFKKLEETSNLPLNWNEVVKKTEQMLKEEEIHIQQYTTALNELNNQIAMEKQDMENIKHLHNKNLEKLIQHAKDKTEGKKETKYKHKQITVSQSRRAAQALRLQKIKDDKQYKLTVQQKKLVSSFLSIEELCKRIKEDVSSIDYTHPIIKEKFREIVNKVRNEIPRTKGQTINWVLIDKLYKYLS